MPESGLHHLDRQLKAAVGLPVDAPARIEVPQCVQARIFGRAIAGDDAGGDLRRMKAFVDDGIAMLDIALGVGEDEDPARSLGTRGGARAMP